MGAIWAVTRLHLRRGWRSLAAVTLLVAMLVSVVLGAFMAAHRGATALDRIVTESRAATVYIHNFDLRNDLRKIADLPYVVDVSRALGGGIGVLDDGHGSATMLDTPVDRSLLAVFEKPVILEGRMFDPDDAKEAVVTQAWVENVGLRVGDRISLHMPSRETSIAGGEELDGPTVDFTIVGVVRVPYFLDWPGTFGAFLPAPGFVDRYRNIWDIADAVPGCACPWGSTSALAVLAHGSDDIEKLRSDLRRLFPGKDFNIIDLDLGRQVHQHDIVFQSLGLVAIGAIAMVAGLVMVGQSIVRHVAAHRADSQTVLALGLVRRQSIVASSTGIAGGAVVGTLLGLVAAAATSRWTPIGIAGVAEPDPGMHVDWAILLPAGVGVVLAATALATVSASVGLNASRVGASAVPSGFVSLVRRARLPLAAQIGAGFALEPGRGPRSVPVVPTLIATVVAVAGTATALVMNAGISDALDNPARYGQFSTTESFAGFGSQDFFDPEAIAQALTETDYVESVLLPRQSTAAFGDHQVGVSLMSYASGEKPFPVSLLSGAMPRGDSEVALAPASLRALRAEVGDTVDVVGSRGSVTAEITGEVLMPMTNTNRYDEGGWVTEDGFDRLFDGFDAHWVMARTSPEAGSDPELHDHIYTDLVGRLGEDGVAPFDGDLYRDQVTTPLRQLSRFPALLGTFLVMLAIAAVGHSLGVAVSRRRHELAQLRALGMTGGAVAATVLWQSLTVLAVGLTVGLPLGLAAGRSLWRRVAETLPLQGVAPSATVLAALAPVALALAVVIAGIPARRARRMPVTAALRSE